MRLLFTLVVVEFGNCQLASLIDAIDSFTEGSGFAFEEFFPNITADDFTFDAILDEIDSLFNEADASVIDQFLAPIFNGTANLTSSEQFEVFEDLFTTTDIQAFANGLSDRVPGLDAFGQDEDNNSSTGTGDNGSGLLKTSCMSLLGLFYLLF